MTFYDILGVPQNATFEQIKKAYREQIKFFHPDVFQENPEIARIKTLELNEAYATLSNANKRAAYDRTIPHQTPPTDNVTQEESSQKKTSNEDSYTKREEPVAEDRHIKITWLDLQPDWFQKLFKILKPVLAFAAVFGIVCLISSFIPSDTENTPSKADTGSKPTSTPSGPLRQNALTTVDIELDLSQLQPPPENGAVLFEDGQDRIAPLTIRTTGTGYYYVKLKDIDTGEDVLCFFVHGGKSADVEAPLGNFELVYAYGPLWFGESLLFGNDTVYARADSIFDFTADDTQVYGWTVELYEQANGNLATENIDASEF